MNPEALSLVRRLEPDPTELFHPISATWGGTRAPAHVFAERSWRMPGTRARLRLGGSALNPIPEALLNFNSPYGMIAKKILEFGCSHMPQSRRAVFQFVLGRSKSVEVLVLAIFLCGCSRGPNRAETKRTQGPQPRNANVLLITLDTLRADHLSCYNPQSVPTPHIDALAARGARFVQAVAQVPLTTPSHASILTGTYPQVHKVRDIGGFVLDHANASSTANPARR